MPLIVKKNVRFLTRSVKIGNLFIGGDHSIKVQSMLNVSTHNTTAAIDQILRLEMSGCDIVRLAVKNKQEALDCEVIKNELIKKNCHIPIVADVHFYPPAAMIALDFVDKVRINPGNFINQTEFSSDENFQKILQDTLLPLIEKCKRLKKPLRLGVNHGSLSLRIFKKYGDSIDGMIASIVEFTNVCRQFDFHDLVFSMKTSTPLLTVKAYEKLVLEMQRLGWNYPLHLGVTEAGEGRDGIIRSSIGIGALLLEGIGDTIRFSLTNEPEEEVNPAKILLKHIEKRTYQCKQKSKNLLGDNPLVLRINTLNDFELLIQEKLPLPFAFLVDDESIFKYIKKTYLGANILQYCDGMLQDLDNKSTYTLIKLKDFLENTNTNLKSIILEISSLELQTQELIINVASDLGFIFSNGLVNGILVNDLMHYRLVLDILQNSGLFNYRAEIISCPGCGRTLYDIQSVVRRIKEKMGHLKNIKIAVMGCVVNGPGEMADADFGYIGSDAGKVDLYVKKTCVEKGIDQEEAVDKLSEIIKAHGRWVSN